MSVIAAICCRRSGVAGRLRGLLEELAASTQHTASITPISDGDHAEVAVKASCLLPALEAELFSLYCSVR